jgi:predicted GTPase
MEAVEPLEAESEPVAEIDVNIDEMLRDMEATVNATDCDVVAIGTPIDLGRNLDIDKPYTRVYYDLQEIGRPDVGTVIDEFLEKQGLVK